MQISKGLKKIQKYQFNKNILVTIWLTAFLLVASSCTIVDNEESDQDKSKLDIYFVDDAFKADDYVSNIWDSKVIPYFEAQAIDLKSVLTVYNGNQDEAGKKLGYREKAEGSPWTFKVKGTARIIKAKLKSKAATLDIDLDPVDGKKDGFVQIGPVIKGTSIRDSLDFVTFGMFTNQIEYAQLANALNRKAYNTVLSGLDRDTIVGKTIYFEGAFTQMPYSSKIMITPVKLEVK